MNEKDISINPMNTTKITREYLKTYTSTFEILDRKKKILRKIKHIKTDTRKLETLNSPTSVEGII